MDHPRTDCGRETPWCGRTGRTQYSWTVQVRKRRPSSYRATEAGTGPEMPESFRHVCLLYRAGRRELQSAACSERSGRATVLSESACGFLEVGPSIDAGASACPDTQLSCAMIRRPRERGHSRLHYRSFISCPVNGRNQRGLLSAPALGFSCSWAFCLYRRQ